MCVHWSVKNSGLFFDPTRDVYPLEMFTTDHLFIKRFRHHHQFQQWNIIVMYPWCSKKGHGYYNIECKGEKTKTIIIILLPDSENRTVTNNIKYVILNSKQKRSIEIVVILHCHFHWKVLSSFLSLIIAFFFFWHLGSLFF